MKCLRCGKCCSFPVGIVKPEFADQFSIDLESDILKKMTVFKNQGEQCPNFKLDGDIASCNIHNMPWFPDTPCGRHGQFEFEDSECRSGKWIKENKIDVRLFYNKED